jgi:hypothetical protein
MNGIGNIAFRKQSSCTQRTFMTPAFKHDTSTLSHNPEFHRLLTGSYERVVGRTLATRGQEASWLYNDAPFVVLAHNTEPDPVFIYANKAAQKCFEYSWDEFVALPSRLSAQTPDRQERQRLLDAVAARGFTDDYRGLRIAKSGRQFWIEGATVWQLIDEDGKNHGQAATFSSWQQVPPT